MASQGPNLVASSSDCTDGGGGANGPWANPGNAATNNGVFATHPSFTGQLTNYLRWTNFGFSIPGGSVITGIEFAVVAKGSGFIDRNIFATKDGSTTVGSNLDGSNTLTGSLATYTYGGSSNLWGTTWTDSEINASTFGIQCQWSYAGFPSTNISVDYAQVTITYTTGSGVTVSATALSGAATLTSATESTGATITSTILAAPGTLLAPTVKYGSTITATALASSATLPSPTVTGGSIYAASALTAPATLLSPTVKFGSTITASPLTGAATLLAPSVLCGSTITASALTAPATLLGPIVKFGSTISASPLTASATLLSPTINRDWIESATALAAPASLLSPTILYDWVQAVSALTVLATLPGPTVIAGGSVVFAVTPLVAAATLIQPMVGNFDEDTPYRLGGDCRLFDGFTVITECNISVSALAAPMTAVETGRSVDPLVANATLLPVSISAPPNFYANVSPLVSLATLPTVTVGHGLAFSVSPLVALATLPDVALATGGNVSINVDPLVCHATLLPVNSWVNWTGTGLVYSVYANDGDGSGIDYDTPIDATMDLTWTSDPLGYPGEWKFGVRVSSLESGLEEKNIDAAIRLVLDDSGVDITRKPKAPVALRVFATVNGGCRAEWAYPYTDRYTKPTGFHVYAGPLNSVDYGTIEATKAYGGPGNYSADLGGFTDGSDYSVAVRAYNATAEESNTSTVSFTADATGPTAVHSLAAIAV